MAEPMIYREVLARGRRKFELYPDRVILHIKYPNRVAELTILLSDLRPTPNKLVIREWPFSMGIGFLLAACLLFAAGLFTTGSNSSEILFIFAIPTLFTGTIISGYCWRKIEFASFVNRQGVSVLDVGDAGPDRGKFREFVDLLIAQISDSNKAQ